MDSKFHLLKTSDWDAVLFEMTLVFGGIFLLLFDIPALNRWFFGYCAFMGILRIVGFVRRRSNAAKEHVREGQ